MKTGLLGLSIPLLLLAAAFAGIAPRAAAQEATLYEVSGRVVSDAGEPLEGVNVNGYTYADASAAADPSASSQAADTDEPTARKMEASSQNAETATDADGRFTLHLAAGKGYLNVWYDKWRVGDGRELVVEDNVTGIAFTLQTPPPRTATIRGVVLGPDGAPIEGAEVTLSYACCYAMPAESVDPVASDDVASSDGGTGASAPSRIAIMPPRYDDHQTTTTDAEGRFTFAAYAGPRQASAWAKGYAQSTQEITAQENETTDVTLRLEKLPARDAVLSGRVLDSDTGLPVQGAHVSARSLEWGRYAEATTGADGRYRIETVPGWTEISVNVWPDYGEPMPLADASEAMLVRPVPGETQYFAYTTILKLASGENDLETKLDAKPKPTIVLVGYVVDPDATKGVEGARVNVWNQETGDWGEAVTDATGSFKILVRPGHYSGNAWKEGHLGGTQTFRVTEDAAQRVDLILPKGETRWAPCYDDNDCGPVLYTSKGMSAVAAGAPPEPGAPAMEDAARSTLQALDGDQSAAAEGPDTSRAASFSGSGGGLPPYDPDATGTMPAAERATPSEVPALSVLVLLGVAALGALAMRRR